MPVGMVRTHLGGSPLPGRAPMPQALKIDPKTLVSRSTLNPRPWNLEEHTWEAAHCLAGTNAASPKYLILKP